MTKKNRKLKTLYEKNDFKKNVKNNFDYKSINKLHTNDLKIKIKIE